MGSRYHHHNHINRLITTSSRPHAVSSQTLFRGTDRPCSHSNHELRDSMRRLRQALRKMPPNQLPRHLSQGHKKRSSMGIRGDKPKSHCGVLDLGVLDKDAACRLCRFFYSIRWPQTPTPAFPSFNHYHLRVFIQVDVSKYSFPKLTSLDGATVCSVFPGNISEFTENTLDSFEKDYYNTAAYSSGHKLATNGYFVPCD